MAYGNWGAKVWCDGQAKHENCDVTVTQVLEGTHYQHYLEHYIQESADKMYHAVVGDEKSGVLVCLYKYLVSNILIVDEGGLTPYQVPEDIEYFLEDMGYGEVFLPNEVKLEMTQIYDAKIGVEFVDKLGRKWEGISGYCMGEGYEEWD